MWLGRRRRIATPLTDPNLHMTNSAHVPTASAKRGLTRHLAVGER